MPNTSAEVTLKWADGSYLFALKGKQIEELQRVCGFNKEPVGIAVIADRVFRGHYYHLDIVETIRLALIGGGTPAVRARDLIDTYVVDQPYDRPGDPSSPLKTATAILDAVFFGVAEIDLKDRDEEEDGAGEGPPKGEAVAGETDEASSTSRPSEPSSSNSTSIPEPPIP